MASCHHATFLIMVIATLVCHQSIAQPVAEDPVLVPVDSSGNSPIVTTESPVAAPTESSLARAEVPSQPPTISNELPPQGTASPVIIVDPSTQPTPETPTTEVSGGCPTDDPCFLNEAEILKVIVGENAVFKCDIGNSDSPIPLFVQWKRRHSILFFEKRRVTYDKRIQLSDDLSTLTIEKVTDKDGDIYRCEINTNPPMSLDHTLDVLVPASAGITPAGDMLKLVEGQELNLTCETNGNPAPKVTWAREGAQLPSGDNIHQGARLPFSSLSRDDSGVYVCTASNGVRSPAVVRVEVVVHHAPVVEASREEIPAREGGNTVLKCVATGDPKPKIVWKRVGTDSITQIDHSRNYRMSEMAVGKSAHSMLQIMDIAEGDFGDYKCSASNILGVDDASLKLTGIPGQVSITSGGACIIDTECSVAFKVTSWNRIVEYQLRVREFNATSGAYGNLTLISVTSTQNQTENDEYAEKVLITDLNPTTYYEIDVTAETKYGVGPASLPHYLTTNYETDGGFSIHDFHSLLVALVCLFTLIVT